MPDIKDEKQTTFFDSIEFVFRHPWLFISPFVIIMSVVFAKLSTVPLVYKANALISFEAMNVQIGSERGMRNFGYRIQEIMQQILVGEGVREIVEEIYPDIDEKDNPARYNALRRQVQGAVNIQHQKKTNFFAISSQSSNPEYCYKVVQSTISALKRGGKKTARRKLEAELNFLKKQEEHYKANMRTIDEEISRIKSELKKMSSELTDEERILIGEVTGEIDLAIRDKTVLQKLTKYDEILAELQLQLLEVQKKKETLELSLETGEYTIKSLLDKDLEQDIFVEQYSEAIADKELIIAKFMSEGYLEEHPQVKRLRKEINNLQQLKQKRIDELKGKWDTEGSESARKIAEERVRDELQGIELEIETLKDKIALITKKYEGASPRPLAESSKVSVLASRLKELRVEKEISQRYYSDIRKRLEEAELRGRIEEAEAGLKLIVVEVPLLPTRPIMFQKTPKIIKGFLIALFLGTGLAYVVETLDNSVKSATELRELVHTPILGSVDRIHTIREIRLRYLRINIIIAGWIAFALSAKFLLRFKLFHIIFSFLK